MPGANAIPAGRNAFNGERPARRGLRVVRVIQNSDPGMSPRMAVGHDLDLGRLFESVERNYFAVIVERRDADDLPGPDVDEAVGVQRPVVVADVERPVRRHRLDVGIEDAMGVGELGPALERKSFSAPDIGKPDNCSADARSGKPDVSLHDRVSAHILIDGGPNDRGFRCGSLELDDTGDRAARNDSDDPVGLGRGRDD